MNTNCRVKALCASELPLLFALFDYSDPDAMLDENARRLADGTNDIFGLFMANKLIGELHAAYEQNDERFAVCGRRAYLFAFRVRRDVRDRGFGQLLLREVMSILAQKGYRELTIGVEDDNACAKHIYDKLGFTQLLDRMRETYQGDSYEFNLYLKTL